MKGLRLYLALLYFSVILVIVGLLLLTPFLPRGFGSPTLQYGFEGLGFFAGIVLGIVPFYFLIRWLKKRRARAPIPQGEAVR